jgi:TolB-like protein
LTSDAANETESRPPSVFLSYASEDREAARLIKDQLPAYGIEVWYDESELGGGEAWDQKIRRQIRDCDYFMALVSAQTEARHEGYFRREWRFAVERTLDMADDHTFLLPVVIDDTAEIGARVPDKFLTVQWLRLPGGKPTPALEALCRRIAAGQVTTSQAPRVAQGRARPAALGAPPALRAFPEFPREEPGQRMRFFAHVIGWAGQSGWIFFKRWPRWLRVLAVIWLIVIVLSRGCTGNAPRQHESEKISPATAQKLKAISDKYQGSSNPADVAKLGAQIAREFADANDEATQREPLLAIPFTAAAGDTAGEKLADATFAQIYGRAAVARHGHVGLSQAPLKTHDLPAALERGRDNHATYILFGSVDSQAPGQLTIKIVTVADSAVLWSQSYPAASADPAKIADEVIAKLPAMDDD